MPTTSDPAHPRVARRPATPALSIYQWMEETASTRRAMLRRFLADNAVTPAQLARQLGLATPNLFYNFLNGRSNSLSAPILELIARHYPTVGVSPQPGEATTGETCRVVAIAATGVEQPAFHLPGDRQTPLPLPADLRLHHTGLFGVRVEGAGAERIYPPESLLICGGVAQATMQTSGLRRLVVTRRWGGGIEVSIREQRTHSDKVWLLSLSDAPEHQAPLTLDDVTVEGVVLASWQPEPGTTLT